MSALRNRTHARFSSRRIDQELQGAQDALIAFEGYSSSGPVLNASVLQRPASRRSGSWFEKVLFQVQHSLDFVPAPEASQTKPPPKAGFRDTGLKCDLVATSTRCFSSHWNLAKRSRLRKVRHGQLLVCLGCISRSKPSVAVSREGSTPSGLPLRFHQEFPIALHQRADFREGG